MDFAGMAVISALPSLLITPWAASVADRLDRRYVILAADATAALSTSAVAFLLWQGTLQLWHLFAINLVGSIAGTFQPRPTTPWRLRCCQRMTCRAPTA